VCCCLAAPYSIQLRLAAGRFHELFDVVSLIDAFDLDESCLENLHPSLRGAYLKCLEEKKREELFLARNG
jgi:hypothetical protein